MDEAVAIAVNSEGAILLSLGRAFELQRHDERRRTTTGYIYKKEISPSIQEMRSATLGAPWPLQGRRINGANCSLVSSDAE